MYALHDRRARSSWSTMLVAPAPDSALLEPQTVSVTVAHFAAICGIRGRHMRIARGISFGFCRREPG